MIVWHISDLTFRKKTSKNPLHVLLLKKLHTKFFLMINIIYADPNWNRNMP